MRTARRGSPRLIAIVVLLALAACAPGNATPAPAATAPAGLTTASGSPSAGAPSPAASVGAATPSSPAVPNPAPGSGAVASSSPVASPSSAASPQPAGTAADEVLGELRIGKPYVLFANPVDDNLAASLAIDVARTHVEATIRGLEVLQTNALVGYAFVLSYDGVPWTSTLFKQAAEGAARNAGGELSYSKIAGMQVATIKANGGSISLFAFHETIVMVVGVTPTLTRTLTTSIIKAS